MGVLLVRARQQVWRLAAAVCLCRLDLAGHSEQPVPLAASCLPADQARQLLKALADPTRLQVIEALAGGERCVCELTEALGLAQSKLSFHLRVLKEAGLLADRHSGRWVYYQLQPGALEQLRAWLADLAGSCTIPAHPCC